MPSQDEKLSSSPLLHGSSIPDPTLPTAARGGKRPAAEDPGLPEALSSSSGSPGEAVAARPDVPTPAAEKDSAPAAEDPAHEPTKKAKKGEDERLPVAEPAYAPPSPKRAEPGASSEPREREDEKTGEPKRRDNQNELFVGNLPYSANEEDIEDFFSRFGPISSVKLLQRVGRVTRYRTDGRQERALSPSETLWTPPEPSTPMARTSRAEP